jgi:class 3 adenylate cyclase/tetratricopeptide (TPR) repeat protein
LPLHRDFWAAILFLDVSGFTRITEAASARGHYGVELVTKVLNRYFGRVHKLIMPLGGEIVKFGGDACLIVFPVQNGTLPDMPALRDAILAETALLDKRFRREYGFPFQIHGAWGIGEVKLGIVGDRRRHLDYFVSSSALKAVYDLAESAATGKILGPAKVSSLQEPKGFAELPSASARLTRQFLPADILRKLSLEPKPAELRNAAVLFIKLSPAGDGEISLEDYQTAFQRVQSLIITHLGLINKIDYNEKGYLILATFGIPFVYGNDTLRAVTAAHRISMLHLPGTGIQIGITYSNIFCGIIGAPLRHEYGIIGNAVNIAARLMSFAQSGEVCLSKELIPHLEGQFETAWLARAAVKGIAEALDIYRLVRALPARWGSIEEQFRADPLYLDPARLQELRQALAGDSEYLCMVRGASGTGKSQLVFKLCEPHLEDQPPFQLITADPHFREQRLEIFFFTMRQEQGITNFQEEFPQIMDWCAAQGIKGNKPDQNSPLRGADSQELALRELLFGAPSSPGKQQIALDMILDMLICLYPQGRMLVLENFHNFDPQSRDLLLRLIRHKLYQSDKIIISSQEGLPEDLCKGFACSELVLDNWDEAFSGRFIRHRVPNITQAAIRMLHQISKGNPRFLRGLLHHIQKHWAASRDLITHQIIADMRERGLLPVDLENLLRADFEALPAPEQLFTRLASIFGKPFRLSEFTRLFSDHSSASLTASAEKLLLMGILRHEPGSDAQVLAFVNPLLPETVYRSILLGEKLDRHRSIATYYSNLESQDEQIWDLIAHHWLRAEDRQEIAIWCAKRAYHYFLAGAYDLSLRMWQQISHWPVDQDALITAELKCAELYLLLADNEKAEQILESLGKLQNSGGIHHDHWVYLRARLMINRSQYTELDDFLNRSGSVIQDPDFRDKIDTAHCEAILQSMDSRLIEAKALPLWNRLKAEERHPALNTLAGIIGSYYINRGDYKTALRYYREKLRLARRLKDPVSMRIGLAGMGIAYSRMGNKAKALDYYQQALELASTSGDRNGFSKALLDLGIYHRNEGELAKALEYYRQSLSLAEYIGNKLQISIVIYDIGELYYYQENWEEAQSYIRRSLEMAKEIGDQAGMSFCYDALGDISFRRGEYPQALAIYRANLLVQHKLSDMEGKAHTLGNLGNLAKMEQHFKRAAKLYRAQIAILEQVGDVDGQGRAWFNLAMLDIELQDSASARTKLNTALVLFKSCNAQYFTDITLQQLDNL